MEGYTIQGWDRIIPEYSGTSLLSRGATFSAKWLHESQPTLKLPVVLGLSHLGAVSIRGISVFVPGLLFYNVRKDYEVEIGPYHLRVRRKFAVSPGGNSRRGLTQMTPPKAAISRWGRGSHPFRGGTDPGELRFCCRIFGVVDVKKDLWSPVWTLSSPGAAELRANLGGQWSPRAASISPNQPQTSQER